MTLQNLNPRSKVNQPTFRGDVSEAGTVTVHVYPGKEAKGTEAGKYNVTTSAAGEWAVVATPALPNGTYTAVATEPSALGNETGKSQGNADLRDRHQTPGSDPETLCPRRSNNTETRLSVTTAGETGR